MSTTSNPNSYTKNKARRAYLNRSASQKIINFWMDRDLANALEDRVRELNTDLSKHLRKLVKDDLSQ